MSSFERNLVTGIEYSPPSTAGGGGGTVTSAGLIISGATDLFSVTGSPITTSGDITVSAIDAGADRIVFWDDSASKLTYLTVGTGLSITGTTINCTVTGTVTQVNLSLPNSTDVFSVSGSPITTTGTLTVSAIDAGADRIVFWDDSANKLTYLSVGTGLTITGTTIEATGTVSTEFADNLFRITGSLDSTKKAAFEVDGFTTATTRTFTLPDANTTIVGTDTTQTLTNKTINSSTIGSSSNVSGAAITTTDSNFTLQDNADATKQARFEVSGITTGTTRTLTVPDANTTLVGTDSTQTLTNKTINISDSNFTLQDNADATKQTRFELSGITTGTTRTLTVPDANTTLVGTDSTQTLTNKTINISDSNFTLQDNVDATKNVKFELSGLSSATSRTLTVPDANTTIVGTDATQTLSNKTFTATSNVFTVRDTNFTIQGSVTTRQVQFNPDSIGSPATIILDIPPINGEITVQGNTFNGNTQLVQTNGSGKIPANTISTTNGGIVFRNSSGNLTDTKTGTDAIEMGDSGYFWHKNAGYFRLGVQGVTSSFFQIQTTGAEVWYSSNGINLNVDASSGTTQIGNGTSAVTLNAGTLTIAGTTIRLNFSTNATGDIYYRNGTDTARLPIGTAGQVLTVNSGVPSWQSPSALLWSEVTGTSQSAAVNTGYITNNAALVTVTLPSTIAVGQSVRIAGKGAGGWRVAQNSGQVIHFGSTDTTTGVTGYIGSTNRYDSVELLCITANTDFVVISVQGTLDVN